MGRPDASRVGVNWTIVRLLSCWKKMNGYYPLFWWKEILRVATESRLHDLT